MIDFLVEMFMAPEAQADAYTWGAVLLAHFTIGVFLTAALGWILGAWRGALVVAVGYAILWEGGQLIFAGADPVDCLVDAGAVALGALVAAGAWRRHGLAVGGALALLAAIGIAGVRRRR